MNYDYKLGAHYLNFQFSENFLGDLDERINIQLPYPLHKPLKNCKVDPIDKFCNDVEDYNSALVTGSKDLTYFKNKILNQSFTNTHGILTQGLLNLCNREKIENFGCDYNPYYNGFLTHLNFEGKEFLVRPDYKNNLRYNDLANSRKSYKLKLAELVDEDITSLSSYEHNASIYCLVKFKKKASLLKIYDICDTVPAIYSKKFKKLILDTKLNESNIAFILSDTKLRLYDIETDQRINISESDNNCLFNCSLTKNSIWLLGRNTLSVIDLRSLDKLNFAPKFLDCDNCSCFKLKDNQIYLATRHHLVRTDMRFTKQAEYCSHMMKNSPCFMDITDNFLILSSQKNDRVLFTGNPVSSLPTEIPDVLNTLTNCKLQNDVLLQSEIDEYLHQSIGGVKLITKENTHLYLSNISGQIFKQKIGNCSEKDDKKAVDTLCDWIGLLPQNVKPLVLTHLANVSDARFALNKKIDFAKLDKFTKNNRKLHYFKNYFKNKYHKDNLGELAANFIAIWNEEDDDEERVKVDLGSQVPPMDKVTDWIESQYFFD